jgi:oxygen-independent coproporphyrinogen-3 oxidase
MSGIYIHIPFCKKACHYCNFHFSTQIEHINDFVEALLKEMTLQQNYLHQPIETIYFGGGTPSLLNEAQLHKILKAIEVNFGISANIELTLEANPDDINIEKTKMWSDQGINRLSIGIQSFQQEALNWMNRAHNTNQSHQSIENAIEAGIHNLSIDLIYGTPHLTNEALINDIEILNNYQIPHVSCYALTVEDKTVLYHLIKDKKIEDVDTNKQAEHFEIIVEQLGKIGFEHYEISNFAKPGHQSKHNSNYWKGIPYLGLGPSAHSYNIESRQWNIANNHLYIENINKGTIPFEVENLETPTRFNEYIMISLRLLEGVNFQEIEDRFGAAYLAHTINIKDQLNNLGQLQNTQKGFCIAKEARFLSDGIASDFFITD